MLDILGKSNVISKGVVNPHEVFGEQGAIEAFEKFLDDPNNIRFIKYFAAEYVSEDLYERLRMLLKKKVRPRRSLTLNERDGREWYEVK